MAAFSRGRVLPRNRASHPPVGHTPSRANIPAQALRAALVDAPVPVLGMSPRRSHNFLARVRLDFISVSADRPRDLRDSGLWISGADFPVAYPIFGTSLSRTRHFGGSRPGGHRPFTLASIPRSWRTGG